MKELIASKSFKKFICVLLCLIVLMTITAISDRSLISNLLSRATLGLQQVSASVSESASSKSYDELLQENSDLNAEVSDLRAQLVDYYDVKQENARLWRYYDLKRDYPQYELLPATVVRRDPSDDFYAFTINQGYADGISVGDPVVTEKGLVGWVCGVDASTARVKTILSPDAKVGSIDMVSRDSGIVTGNVYYSDQGLTTMTKVSAQHKMVKGDIIITTGISGIYPPSLILGEVLEVKYDEYDTSTYAVIKPYEDIKTVIDVVVITGFEGQGEISDNAVTDVIPSEAPTTAPTEEPSTEASESTAESEEYEDYYSYDEYNEYYDYDYYEDDYYAYGY